MNKTILLLMLVCLSAVSVLGASVTLNESLINSSGINTTINVTNNIYFDVLDVSSGGIYFENFTPTNSTTTYMTFNITNENQTYFWNDSNMDLPYVSSIGTLTVTITNNINNTDMTAVFPFACANVYNYSVVSNADSLSGYSCNSDVVTITVDNAQSGSIEIDFSARLSQQCNTMISGLGSVGNQMGLIVLGIIISFIASLYYSSKKEVNWDQMVKNAEASISIGIILSIGVIVLANLCL